MKTIKNTLFAVLFILVSTISLAQTKIPLVVTPSVTNPTCQNLDGQIELTITGGYPPYVVNGSQINTSLFVATGLGAGAYSFTVTDLYSSYVGLIDILLVSPSAVQVSALVNNVTTLGGSNGSIQLSVTSTTPVTYLWETNSTIPLINNTIEDQINIPAGVYKVSITDLYGCEYSKRFTVSEVITMPSFNPNINIAIPNQPSSINIQSTTSSTNMYDSKVLNINNYQIFDMSGKQVNLDYAPSGMYLVMDNNIVVTKIYK